jgi:GMP synthase-like glutamine amidotransferase
MQNIRFHFIQHVPFENPAAIADWVEANHYTSSYTYVYEDSSFPSIETFDCLVVMGGPMGVYDEVEFPWLKAEKEFIDQAVFCGKKVIGICLGAQLLANVLGAKVYKNKHKEIGWFPVRLTENGEFHPAFRHVPVQHTVFQWHGDTFDLPAEAVLLATSEACKNQAFIYDNRVLALQYHLEVKKESVEALLSHCADDLTPGAYVQVNEDIRNVSRVEANIELLHTILPQFLAL